MKSRTIDEIRQQFQKEWLLITVERTDPGTGNPLTGKLLAHSPDPMEIHKVAMKQDGFLATIYSDDWPDDLAACFIIF
ncbi:MAG: hypothetical protein HYY44_03735 [Deltaproteobacteria bacterium]|nr:hypothetical protein [Deltaproteobacteria bacterium]